MSEANGKPVSFDPKLPHVIVFADPRTVTAENLHGVQVAKSANLTDHELALMLLNLGAARIAQHMYDTRKFSQNVVLPDGSRAPLPDPVAAPTEG